MSEALTKEKPYHTLSVIPDIDKKILDAIAEGKSLQAIGDEYGVTDSAIFSRAMKQPDYHAKRDIGAELRMDRRERELEGAESNVDVTRADRLLGHARWLAERTTERFSQKGQNINIINNSLTVSGELAGVAGSLLQALEQRNPVSVQSQPVDSNDSVTALTRR